MNLTSKNCLVIYIIISLVTMSLALTATVHPNLIFPAMIGILLSLAGIMEKYLAGTL